MKSQSTIRRSMIATLLVFATAAIGLQPLAFNSDSGCECSAVESGKVVASVTETSCCATPVAALEQGCCSTTQPSPSATKGCCCNPEATLCKCVDCKCNVKDEQPIPQSPAIPTNETIEIVSPVLICSVPLVCHPRDAGARRLAHQRSALEFAALSSQERCVLLSRFTC